MIYVIDHNDSFTHNVVHQFALFDKVECDNYDEISENKIKQASTIIFSPGPGNPKNYPITSKIYKKYKGKKFQDNEFFFDYLKKEIKEKRKMGHFTEINKIND